VPWFCPESVLSLFGMFHIYRFQQTSMHSENLQENRGGMVLAFLSTAPRIGSGALTTSPSTAASSLFNTDKEYTLYVPANKMWPEIGQAMVEEGVGVCLWAAGEREIGLESIGESTGSLVDFIKILALFLV
jgi:hypothetical protein